MIETKLFHLIKLYSTLIEISFRGSRRRRIRPGQGMRGHRIRIEGMHRPQKQAKKSARVAADDDSTQPLTYQLSAALRLPGGVRSPAYARVAYPRAALAAFDTD